MKPQRRRIQCGTESLICRSIRCAFFRCHQGTCCGLLDKISDGLRLGQEHGVTAFDLTTVEPARLDIALWASGGIILSSVVMRNQLGLVLHAGWVMAPPSASTPHGTWESAMN